MQLQAFVISPSKGGHSTILLSAHTVQSTTLISCGCPAAGYCQISCGRCNCCKTYSTVLTNLGASTFLQVCCDCSKVALASASAVVQCLVYAVTRAATSIGAIHYWLNLSLRSLTGRKGCGAWQESHEAGILVHAACAVRRCILVLPHPQPCVSISGKTYCSVQKS